MNEGKNKMNEEKVCENCGTEFVEDDHDFQMVKVDGFEVHRVCVEDFKRFRALEAEMDARCDDH